MTARLAALLAAYAIALASLLAGFNAASAAAQAAQSGGLGVICHDYGAGATHPADAPGHSKLCLDCCTAACPMFTADLPSTAAVAILRAPASGTRLAVLAAAPTPAPARLHGHRSRAPPLPA